MWGNNLHDEQIELLERRIDSLLNTVNDTHRVCELCKITGHKVDMHEEVLCVSCLPPYRISRWFHNGCYAEKFNKHLCPCKCGKWIDNKKKGCK